MYFSGKSDVCRAAGTALPIGKFCLQLSSDLGSDLPCRGCKHQEKQNNVREMSVFHLASGKRKCQNRMP